MRRALVLLRSLSLNFFFFFNDTATTEIYTLSLHDALPILLLLASGRMEGLSWAKFAECLAGMQTGTKEDRKSTRLNSSHSQISYAVFCLKKKKPTLVLSLALSLTLVKSFLLVPYRFCLCLL